MSNLCGDCGELQIQTMNFGGDGIGGNAIGKTDGELAQVRKN